MCRCAGMAVMRGLCNGNEPSVARSRKNAEPDRHARDLHRALGRRFAAQGGDGVAPAAVRRRGLLLAGKPAPVVRSEEHTSELQSLMRSSYAVFCLKKKKPKQQE